jgi:2,4-didehydro-3-deoxy-L-rhamnonate hydrolase
MKLVRFGAAGRERPGLVDRDGRIRDLSGLVSDISGAELSEENLSRLAGLDTYSLPLVDEPVRLGPPVARTRSFIAVGLNYADHAAEARVAVPDEPLLFTKVASCIQGPNDAVRKPRGSTKLDWEVELGMVIGKRLRYVETGEALDHVAGFIVCNDVSERQFQYDRGGTLAKGKGCETFGPIGPWLVTKDEVGDAQSLELWLTVNGERMQTGNTSSMVFDCATLVSYISQLMVLEPGDIITTGTPAGVGMGMRPPRFLDVGDVVELGIEKLGSQRYHIIAWDAA